MQLARSASPLRLPAPSFEPTDPHGDDPRTSLELLARRRFHGRALFEAADWSAELLLRGGEVLAAALAGPVGLGPLVGEPALRALLQPGGVPWSWRAASLGDDLMLCLTGLGGAPTRTPCPGPLELRGTLRNLALSGQPGLVELAAGPRWGRVPVAPGRLLGCWAAHSPELRPDLAALEPVLATGAAEVLWYPGLGATAPVLRPPSEAPARDAESQAVLERYLVWLVSDFEAAWARARERGAEAQALLPALALLLSRLQRLATTVEIAWTSDARQLEARLRDLAEGDPEAHASSRLDSRLAGAHPRQAGAITVELIVEALDRLVNACPEAALAESCRQTADALEAELRAALATAPAASPNGTTTPVASGGVL